MDQFRTIDSFTVQISDLCQDKVRFPSTTINHRLKPHIFPRSSVVLASILYDLNLIGIRRFPITSFKPRPTARDEPPVVRKDKILNLLARIAGIQTLSNTTAEYRPIPLVHPALALRIGQLISSFFTRLNAEGFGIEPGKRRNGSVHLLKWQALQWLRPSYGVLGDWGIHLITGVSLDIWIQLYM